MDVVFSPTPTPVVPVVGVQSVFPVRRIFCIGRNYADHARESVAMDAKPAAGAEREPPFFFCKPADAIAPAAAGVVSVPYPPRTQNLQHEVELVVALGAGGADISTDDAARCIFGYAIGFDLTRRDLQLIMRDQKKPWEIGKAFDFSAPISAITPVAQSGVLGRGVITCDVNGEQRQAGDLSDMIWPVADIIAHVSQYVRLAAGDLIFTGTPAGVGPINRGDTLVGSIEGLGSLTLTVA